MVQQSGIIYREGPTGPRAGIVGTGLDVWEVIATWREVDEVFEALIESYPALTPSQLQVALQFYRDSPDEIDARLAREEAWTPERVYRELPFARLRD